MDRLDYTKGIPRKLLAMERLLERSPQYRGKVRLLQIAVPSRENVAEYKRPARGRRGARGAGSTARAGHCTTQPIHYLYQPLTQEELVATYRAAEIMVVTPLRDGMNLVAKEYVASRSDGDGVLVLSELAGAASELGEALTVNPYDVESIAVSLERALSMPETERRERDVRTARQGARAAGRALGADFRGSARHRPARVGTPRFAPTIRLNSKRWPAAWRRALKCCSRWTTTEPWCRSREIPIWRARTLPCVNSWACSAANARAGSVRRQCRAQSSLAAWLGELPIHLIAEHGVWSKRAQASEWKCHIDPGSLDWLGDAKNILQTYVQRAPGAFLEEKTAGLAWHYRLVDPYLGVALAP